MGKSDFSSLEFCSSATNDQTGKPRHVLTENWMLYKKGLLWIFDKCTPSEVTQGQSWNYCKL